MQSTNGMPDDSISTEVSAILNMYVYAQAETMDEQENKELSWAINDAAEKIAALLHQYAQRQVAAELRAILAEADKQRPTLVAQHRLDEIYGYDAGISAVTAPIARRLKHLTQEQTP